VNNFGAFFFSMFVRFQSCSINKYSFCMFTNKMLQVVVIFLLSIPAYAQQINAADSVKVLGLLENGKEIFEEDPKKGLDLANQALDLSKKHQFILGYVKGYNLLGLICGRQSKHRESSAYFSQAIGYARKYGYSKDLGNILSNATSLHLNMADYDKAFQYATEALNIRIKNKDTLGIAQGYRTLAKSYFYKGEVDKSITYVNKALEIFRQLNNKRNLQRALIDAGVIYIEAKKYPIALQRLQESAKIAASIGDTGTLTMLYLNTGLCYDQMKQNKAAELYYLKAIQNAKVNEEYDTGVVAHNNLGELYLSDKNYKKAALHLNEALAGAKAVNSFADIKDIYGNLARLYAEQQDFKKAYFNKELFAIYADSVMNEDKIDAVEEMAAKFETKEIEDKNKLLVKENALTKLRAEQENTQKKNLLYVLLFLGIIIVVGALAVYFYVKQKNTSNANKNNELKQKLLLTQMNPHFIFNSVDNIQSLIYAKKNDEAINYLTKFSKLTRQILENSTENYIPLSEELLMTANYLVIQQLLYNNKFNYTIETEDTIDTENILIPPMLTQPFIENAVKHGLRDKKEGGIIDVRFYLKDNILLFEVLDNGSGLASKVDSGHKSLATQIVTERLARSGRNITIQTANIVNDGTVSGAFTKFEIPYIYDR